MNDGSKNKGGRPKGSFSNSTKTAMLMREQLVKKVNKELKPILQAQSDAAKGIVVEKIVTLDDGKKAPRYYRKEPDINAGKYLIDQALGKPKESIEHSGEVKTFEEKITELDSQH